MAQTANAETEGYQAELVASLLFRYPEICSIKIQPAKGTLSLTFLPRGRVDDDSWQRLETTLQASLEAYHQIQACPMAELYITSHQVDEYVLIEITRDLKTLQREELSLIVAIVREACLDGLMMESSDAVIARDLEWQDELIDHMLEDVRTKHQCQDIIAFREAGRVIVFNRGKLDQPKRQKK